MNVSPFSEEMDGLFCDPFLREFILEVTTAYYSWEDNTEQMYSGDYLSWMVDIMDAKLTGEHNSGVRRAKNPKAKPKVGQEIKSFARFMMPPRWARIYHAAEQKQAENKMTEADVADNMIAKMVKEAGRHLN